MTCEFTASGDYKTIVHGALERITKYVGAEAASLFLVTDNGETLMRYGNTIAMLALDVIRKR